MSEIDVGAAEIEALDESAPEAEILTRKLGWTFWLAIGWLVVVIGAAIFAPWLPIKDPDANYINRDFGRPPYSPNTTHWFGTDQDARDMFSRTIFGARVSLVVGFVAIACGMIIGGTLGMIAGYFRGWWDRIISFVFIVLLSFPALVLAILITSLLDRGLFTIAAVLGFLAIAPVGRLARATTIQYAEREFVLAARTLGAHHPRIIIRELLPNVVIPMGALALLGMAIAIVAEGGLAFLGLSVAKEETWGKLILIGSGSRDLENSPWVSMAPILILFLTVLALNYAGDKVRAHFDVKEIAREHAVHRREVGRPVNVHLQTEGRVSEGTLLAVDDVKTHFRTERGLVRAVDGVDFTLERGEALGIVGESGSGKTVLSRTIMGLLPSTAVLSGSIQFSGQEILGLDAKQMRHLWGREMSMVFQNPMVSLNPLMKIGKQIAEPLQIHLGMDKQGARETAEQLLRDVRIPEPHKRLSQFPHELSGGMRQRVMIAIALACGPTLLFADEPTTALDVTVQAQILELIGEQRQDRNMSVILVTHDLGVVAGHTDQIAVMYGGRLVEKAPTKELFAHMRMPYTKSLMRSIPKLDDPSHSRLLTIPGRPPDLVSPPAGCRFAPRCGYVRDRCLTEEPPLVTADTSKDHVYACWYPVGSPEFQERDEQIMNGLHTAAVQVEDHN